MKTIIEKIWNSHVVEEREGFPDILAIDLQLVHEVTSPQAFQVLKERNLRVFAPHRTLATVDHNVPTKREGLLIQNPISRHQIETLRENCRTFDIPLLDMGSGYQGIVHVIGPELGFTHPGMTIVCGDSHTSTHGAFGALAFGIGTSEVAQVLATGCILQKKPKTMRVHFKGDLPIGVTAKDIILALIRKIGVNGATGHVIEYTGEPLKTLSMDERMTICNMSIECGARAGLMAPDEITFAYIRDRIGAPKGPKWGRALAFWKTLSTDQGATYDQEIVLSLEGMAPMVTWGINPEQTIAINEPVPNPLAFSDEMQDLAAKAIAYAKLTPGNPIEGLPIDYVFIGSCTNARLSDLRAAANVMKGRKVAPGVKVLIVPGSETIHRLAIEEGLAAIFIEAGAEYRAPGCSMCLAMNEDRVPPGKRCASTSNRNFIGRQGPESITHLMSPIMAAAAAITGKITDIRNIL
ncbi:MAG: 3-isopropylmalate dehydratase large subunit [Parachlamydia sp.]|nr:MAG: 3-isopropylmalate dehydratase large subunit [Parachlamydia sp.]